MFGVTTVNLDLDRDHAQPANRCSVARKAAREQRFEEHAAMHYDSTVHQMVVSARIKEAMAEADQARLSAAARYERPSSVTRACRIVGAMLVRIGERLQGAPRPAAKRPASSVTGSALRMSR